MKLLGIDIGTTTLSAVVLEEKKVLASMTLNSESFLPTEFEWEKIQDPAKIRNKVLAMIQTLTRRYPEVDAIGITGQMHGILYLDKNGEPVSPLFTWQDRSGDLKDESGMSYVEALQQRTGYPLATGYGMVTHFYRLKNELVPESAVVFTTIQSYLAMLLTDSTTPLVDASDAAGLGLFDLKQGCFDVAALKKAEIDGSMLPGLAKEPCIGRYREAIPVYVAVGDNQASFFGASGGEYEVMLLNVGTGSQFSVYTKQFAQYDGLETRPFPGGGYLLVGASLCGGRAYAILESFFRDTVKKIAGVEMPSCYEKMEEVMNTSQELQELPVTNPLFQGTRQDASIRGSISGLTPDNFTPEALIFSMLKGMARELFQMYLNYVNAGGTVKKLIGAGNGLRKNRYLQNCFSELFGQQLIMSAGAEEAATGAALLAGNWRIQNG